MKFRKSPNPRAGFDYHRSPQRVAAARRAVQREKDNYALFPQFVTHNTAEERLNALEIHNREWNQKRRDHDAQGWRRARRELRQLPPSIKAGLIRYWQSEAWLPREPAYLLSEIHSAKIGRTNHWRCLRILRQFRLLREGRLPATVFKAVRAWD